MLELVVPNDWSGKSVSSTKVESSISSVTTTKLSTFHFYWGNWPIGTGPATSLIADLFLTWVLNLLFGHEFLELLIQYHGLPLSEDKESSLMGLFSSRLDFWMLVCFPCNGFTFCPMVALICSAVSRMLFLTSLPRLLGKSCDIPESDWWDFKLSLSFSFVLYLSWNPPSELSGADTDSRVPWANWHFSLITTFTNIAWHHRIMWGAARRTTGGIWLSILLSRRPTRADFW